MLKRCVLFLLPAALMVTAYADAFGLSGRYEMNATGNLFIMDLWTDGGPIEGEMRQYLNEDGHPADMYMPILNGVAVQLDDGRHYVEWDVEVFDEHSESVEVYTLEGWQSNDGRFIGGLAHSRQNPLYMVPWHATRPNHCPAHDDDPWEGEDGMPQ